MSNFTLNTWRNYSDTKCNTLSIVYLNSSLLWLGKFFYFFLMVFFFLGVTKVDEFLMISIEKITSQKRETKKKNSIGLIEIGEKKLWSNSIADLTWRALGSNSFEILYPLSEIVFGKMEQSVDSPELPIIIVISKLNLTEKNAVLGSRVYVSNPYSDKNQAK